MVPTLSMKRTLVVGLLGALSTLPISLWTVYLILTLGGPKYLSGGGIETKGTHLFYTATGRVAALLPAEHLTLIGNIPLTAVRGPHHSSFSNSVTT